MNLEQMIEKAKLEDSAFKEIYDLTIHRLYSFVLLRIRDKGEAHDICQEIYSSFWKTLPRFTYMSDAHFFAYLFKIARRELIKSRNRSYGKVDLDEIYDVPAEESEREDYRTLLLHMSNLSDNERTVLELRYFEDMKFGELAAMLGLSENNAKVLHHRALKKLKDSLGDIYE
jgi:RNA polymerase sigma-70 factor (ECF subfamily)